MTMDEELSIVELGATVRVRRYTDGRLTMNLVGMIVQVGDSGFRLKGADFDTHLSHDPTGRNVEHPIKQVVGPVFDTF